MNIAAERISSEKTADVRHFRADQAERGDFQNEKKADSTSYPVALALCVRLPALERVFSVGGNKSPQVPRRPAILTTNDIPTIEQLPLKDLRAEWTKLYGMPPPLRSPELLRLILAWRIQAKAHGGLDRAARRKLKGTGSAIVEGLDLGAGTKLTREWQGVTEEVLVETKGFRWRGDLYPSLSAVASAITGTRWNGPRFFGLRSPE